MLEFARLLACLFHLLPTTQATLRCEDPLLKRGAGMSHEVVMAASVIQLRKELAVHPTTAFDIIDHSNTWYITPEVTAYWRRRYGGGAMVPATEGQD